jgi:hypothetical protein
MILTLACRTTPEPPSCYRFNAISIAAVALEIRSSASGCFVVLQGRRWARQPRGRCG